MFAIKLIGLYGLDDHDAYYREQGDCFDFVNSRDYCTKYDADCYPRIKKTFDYKEWYIKQYGAKDLVLVDINPDDDTETIVDLSSEISDEDYKLKLNICVQTCLHFNNGNVSGEIIVKPKTIADAFYYEFNFPDKDWNLQLRKMIAKMDTFKRDHHMSDKIILRDGVVEKNMMQMTAKQAIELLEEYMYIDQITSPVYKQRDLFMKIKKFVLMCNNLNYTYETASVVWEDACGENE